MIRCLIMTMLTASQLVIAPQSFAGPKVTVGQYVAAASRVNLERIEHSTWGRLLHQYVDSEGNVDYSRWKRSSAGTKALDNYLLTLGRADHSVASPKQDRVAFWINAYNALTIKGILREYPTSSIRNHTAKVVGYNIWKDLLLIVGDEQLSLDDIEHRILRKTGEPRIHFAIVCASHSCPRLLNEAYTSTSLDAQLTTNAWHFFADSSNLRFDASNGHLELSSILDWFGEDFGRNQLQQLTAVSPYVPPHVATAIRRKQIRKISYIEYDWSLNDLATAEKRGRIPRSVAPEHGTTPILQTGFQTVAGQHEIGTGLSLQRACSNCESGNHLTAAIEVRRTAEYLKQLARNSTVRGKAALMTSADELERLAGDIEAQSVKSTQQLRSVVARTHHSLATHYQSLLTEHSPERDAGKSLENAKAAAGHLKSAVYFSGKSVGAGTARTLEKTRQLGSTVGEDTGAALQSIGEVSGRLADAVEDVANLIVFPK